LAEVLRHGGRRAVLVTRPQPGAAQTARRVAAMGLHPIVAPMLRILPLAAELPPPGFIQAILVTSANALPALGPEFHDTPLLAVGDATASRAADAGFRQVRSATGDADALAALAITACGPPGTLLLVGAQGQGVALADRLRHAGFSVVHHVVYAAIPATALPEEALTALADGTLAAALFFSPVTSVTFAALASGLPRTMMADTDAIAISAAAASPLFPLPWRRIRVASRPNQEELLALLA
jgi:uroporphyrinogen-III synthase